MFVHKLHLQSPLSLGIIIGHRVNRHIVEFRCNFPGLDLPAELYARFVHRNTPLFLSANCIFPLETLQPISLVVSSVIMTSYD
jgi:hypothetical protein